MEAPHERIFEQVQEHAVRRLRWPQRQTANLYLDRRVIERGAMIGPEHMKVVTERPTILVFVDEEPLANFGHACRYLLYDAGSGKLDREIHAQLPPFREKPPETLRPFHRPVRFLPPQVLHPLRPHFRCPPLWDRGRYAILWSGMSNKRHLNDMEFLYRTLVDRYGFEPENIYALSYDGSLNTQDGVQTNWPGDGTAYRIQIHGEGTRAGFEGAVDDLKSRLDRHDLVLIHTNNHGDYDGIPGSASNCTYPSWDRHYATDFAAKLGQLPRFRRLMCMLEPCHAGGFNAPILAASTADATSVAPAATEPNNSYVSADGNWDPFARDWIAAQAGHDPFGGALGFDPDSDHDGRVEAEEAFAYANVVKDPRDTPNFDESSAAGGDISLGRRSVAWWWWCLIFRRHLERHYLNLPIPEYHERLRTIEPEMAKLAEMLDQRAEELRKEIEPRVEALVEEAFRGERE